MHRGHSTNTWVFRDGERHRQIAPTLLCVLSAVVHLIARLTVSAWRCQFDDEVIKALEEGELYGDACGEASALQCTGNSIVVAQEVQVIP